MMSKKSPQLRFEGFADAWEERKLGNYIIQYSEKTKQNNQYPVFTSSRNGLFFQKDYYKGNQIASEDNTGYNIVPRGYFTYRHMSDDLVFKFNINDLADYGIVSTLYPVFTTNEQLDSKYLQYQLNEGSEFKRFSLLQKQGGSRTYMYLNKLQNMILTIPKLEEQQKIGSFFKQLDDTIALHQRKLDLLKEQKKGYLQKMFPKNGAKVPELRFAGFADDWEERKFKDIIEKLTGGASIKPSDYLEEGIRTIPKGAVNSTGLADLSGSKYISEEFYESNKSSHVSTNNLVTSLRDLVPSAPNMGRIVRIAGEDEDFLMPQGVYKLELFDGMDEEFLIAFSNSDKYRKIISSEKNGSTQVHIRNGEFLNIDIELPFSEEQKQIGSFFKQLDNSIALHQRKLDLLKEQKKGYLQKMFPKNGAKVPELRFAGFTDAWELRKSKELCTISTGKGNTQDKVDDGAYPFYVRSATIEKSDEYLYDQEAVLTVGDGVGTGKVYHYVNGKYNLHQRVYRMYDFKDVSAKYFYYYFSNNFYKRVMSMTAKTSVDSVRMEMIADMNIVFPSVKEQENIVELFSNLDNTIALHQRKLDLLKEQKKGFLQKMFV